MIPILRPLQAGDIAQVVAAFAELGWGGKDAPQFERYLAEHESGTRVTRFAFVGGVFAGYLNVVWLSAYPPFAAALVPEITDFNVLPRFRRQGIGTALMEEAERLIAARSPVAGVGVGMTRDYGNAQRLYVRRGYVPDGSGLTTHGRPLAYGESVVGRPRAVLHEATICIMNETFFDAVNKGQTESVLSLLNSGVDVNTRNSCGMTALMVAAKRGNTEIAQALLDGNADVNAQATYYGWTALAYAANRGYEDIVRLLLEHNADPDCKAERGKTALVLAADRGHTTTVIALLEAGADACAAPDHHGWTALGRAVKNGHLEIAQALRDAGAGTHGA